ncbi:MAG: DUF2892 domain-containing protein [Candidatus Altiarchaeales archaeon]|nr:DUF2892 domain-containing protein [Candidatus Altiarchaeales archaeon]
MRLDFLTEENVGGVDLFLRAVLGTLSLVVLALDLASGSLKWVLAAVAFIGIFSGLTRHCTPYSLFGFSTAKKCCK